MKIPSYPRSAFGYGFVLMLSLALLGIGGCATWYGFFRGYQGLDTSALIAGASFSTPGLVILALWIVFLLRPTANWIEIDTAHSTLAIYRHKQLHSRRPWANTGTLRIDTLFSTVGASPTATAHFHYLVRASGFQVHLFSSDSRAKAERFASELVRLCGLALDDPASQERRSDTDDQVAQLTKIKALEKAGDERRLLECLDPNGNFRRPSSASLLETPNEAALRALSHIGTDTAAAELRRPKESLFAGNRSFAKLADEAIEAIGARGAYR